MFDRKRKGERALLLQPWLGGRRDSAALDEFRELGRSAGASVLDEVEVNLRQGKPSHLIGSGKVIEVAARVAELGVDLVLVNHPLSPVQERNLERSLSCRVVDRTGLILDIFAQRARSHEGKLQVELAQLRHLATRLVRGWTHLERQRGGIGLRGPGETQLETDRRLLAGRVKALSAQLQQVEAQRNQSRRARVRSERPLLALVGYTNAGKSTLFNALTGADVHAADQLFATLDPTVRRLDGLSCGPLLLADTVGFVSDLPHDLVAAFRATLQEAREADLLVHIVDAADPHRDQRMAQVRAVLAEIGAESVPELVVYNKIDLLERPPRVDRDEADLPQAVWLSAQTGAGVELLTLALVERMAPDRIQARLHLGPAEAGLRARLFELGVVRAELPEDDGWQLDLQMPRALAEQICGQWREQAEALRRLLLAAPEGDTYNPGSAAPS